MSFKVYSTRDGLSWAVKSWWDDGGHGRDDGAVWGSPLDRCGRIGGVFSSVCLSVVKGCFDKCQTGTSAIEVRLGQLTGI